MKEYRVQSTDERAKMIACLYSDENDDEDDDYLSPGRCPGLSSLAPAGHFHL